MGEGGKDFIRAAKTGDAAVIGHQNGAARHLADFDDVFQQAVGGDDADLAGDARKIVPRVAASDGLVAADDGDEFFALDLLGVALRVFHQAGEAHGAGRNRRPGRLPNRESELSAVLRRQQRELESGCVAGTALHGQLTGQARTRVAVFGYGSVRAWQSLRSSQTLL